MTPEQNKLIDQTLGILGYLSFFGIAGLATISIIDTVMSNRNFGNILQILLDIDEAGFIFYPLIVIGIICLWTRALLRAGKTRN